MAKAAAKPKKEISMEEALWKSADKLRGSVEPADYKHIVLSLFFLKFASDKFEAQRKAIAEKFGEKFIDAFGTNMVADILPFNKIPILADVAEGVLSLVGLGYFSTDRLDTVWLADIVKACESWIKVIGEAVGTKNTSLTAYKAIYDTAKAFSSATGVSFSGALRELVTLWNNTAGAVDPELKIKKYEN